MSSYINLPKQPWLTSQVTLNNSAFVIDNEGLTVAEVHGDSRQDALAVARALAATPEMISALEVALEALLFPGVPERRSSAISCIRNALLKAE